MQIKNKSILGFTSGFATAFAIGAVVSLQAGPLTPPPTAVSGGAPVSTMRTLDQVTPTWDRILPANNTGDPCNSARFTCVMGGAAVRDNETGLVWQRSPSAKNTWAIAVTQCTALTIVGGRIGWRLPTVEELASLLDGNVGSPFLPIGHPFTNVQVQSGEEYWSATSSVSDTQLVWVVGFSNGGSFNEAKAPPNTNNIWCVRGGQGISGH
jgi:hypothetical protein